MLYLNSKEQNIEDVQLEELKIKIQSLIDKMSDAIQKICPMGDKIK